MARAAAGAPGPVRPRPPRAAGSAVISWPSRMPMGTGPGGAGTVPGWPGGCAGNQAGGGGCGPPGFAGAGEGLLVRLVQVQVQVRVGVIRAGAVCRGCPVAGVRAARSRAEMTGGGGAAGSRLEVSTVPGR